MDETITNKSNRCTVVLDNSAECNAYCRYSVFVMGWSKANRMEKIIHNETSCGKHILFLVSTCSKTV